MLTNTEWREEYRAKKAYSHLTEEQLSDRYVSLVQNMIEFDGTGKPSVIRHTTIPYWAKRLCWTEEEFSARSLMDRAIELERLVLDRPRPKLLSAQKLFAEVALPELGSYIVKFSKRPYVEEMLAKGRFRISPASSYNDPSLNHALQDNELASEIFFPAGTRLSIKIGDEYREIPELTGPLRHTRHCDDFYVFCASAILDPRLFDEFDADACLVVKDLQQFGLPLVQGFAAKAGMTKVAHGSVYYQDPAHPSPEPRLVDMTKHFRHEYQKEWRIAWRPEQPLPNDVGPVFVEIGSLDHCCEAYYL